jgi:hypothetical protein
MAAVYGDNHWTLMCPSALRVANHNPCWVLFLMSHAHLDHKGPALSTRGL